MSTKGNSAEHALSGRWLIRNCLVLLDGMGADNRKGRNSVRPNSPKVVA
jgi:hypothetical protein